MASKLSDDKKTSVLLVERGEWDTDPFIYNTSDWYYHWGMNPTPLYIHKYFGESEPRLNGKKPINLLSNMVGGCSSMNGMVSNSGSFIFDYEKWGEITGAKENWSGEIAKGLFKEFLDDFPIYFENRNRTWLNEIGQAIERSLGYQWNRDGYIHLDPSGYSTKQFWMTPMQRRISPYSQLLKDSKALETRCNLNILVNHRAVKMEYASNWKRQVVVTGVWIQNTQTKKRWFIKVRKEVIVSMGAVETPKFLQLNGIGDKGRLESLGIPVVVDSPGVGRNLQDHTEVFYLGRSVARSLVNITYTIRNSVIDGYTIFGPRNASTQGHKYLVNIDIIQRVGYVPTFACNIESNRPESRGYVEINSKDPLADPVIFTNYYSDPRDLEYVILGLQECVQVQEELTKMGVLDPSTPIPLGPQSTRSDYTNYIIATSMTDYHLSSTVRMGHSKDPSSPLDGNLQVKGLKNVRVVDASVFPFIPGANLATPLSLLSYQAAKLIKKSTTSN
ncbi:hypothetical protein DFA_06387 [Cavenderia fasciculata]|uniref:Glucose-methanol-choline oxidoreductase N-terminal domain-containing protein n=1 Tax=Cavenderia fasciculata TaxID=261658 RepID=F4PIV3_CACFS|nr:uncharacterized protein DFA_06387 [Cavenderia fasciculata]EGG24239.1 hypothetical protein DFA_06387 [Cavenderia fasciculata]|eukprot:XP_004362090.1 hypothetical protein DFA_06387 [Cavenderia fasciculata]